jgi:protein-tyrosine phosphatase
LTYDHIYVMDQSNYKNVLNSRKGTQKQSANHLKWLYPNENVDVPDPYFGMTNGFEIVYTMLDEVCDIIADKLIA